MLALRLLAVIQVHQLLDAVFNHFDNLIAILRLKVFFLLIVHFFIINFDFLIVTDFDL